MVRQSRLSALRLSYRQLVFNHRVVQGVNYHIIIETYDNQTPKLLYSLSISSPISSRALRSYEERSRSFLFILSGYFSSFLGVIRRDGMVALELGRTDRLLVISLPLMQVSSLSISPKKRLRVEQIATQAGCSPKASKSLHPSHLPIAPFCNSMGAPYGQAVIQTLHPMHIF